VTGLPKRFKVVRTDRELEMPRVDAGLREAGGRLVLLADGTAEDELAREVADADLLLMCYARIGRQVIAGAGKLKAIIKYGVGIDAIDIDAAREQGIPVVNVPAYAEETVAEGAFALLMALFKRFKPIHQAMQQDGWAWPESRWLASDLSGKTLGLVGLGRIGRCMARMAGAFRMRVIAYDPHLPASALPPGVQRSNTLDALLQASDAVSVHCVLNAQTRRLLGAEQLALMKPSAFLVNVSRGEIVDEAALLQALNERRIAGAALDVYGQEPLSRQGHPLSALYGMENVMLWPHLSFYTHEAMQRLEGETLARCFEALRGQPLRVASRDPRLRAQTRGVRFVDDS
jgi:D-3-phosphoglycerate dehydrogenase / 2-oxoglutarate reductase